MRFTLGAVAWEKCFDNYAMSSEVNVADEDPLAIALGELMREQDKIDPRLEKHARGELSAAEREALFEEAKNDPRLALAVQLYTPLSSQTIDRLSTIRPPARVRWLRVVVPVLAAAAAIVIAFLMFPGGDELPAYTLRARAGDAEFRGAAATKNVLRADSELEVVLTPAEPVRTAVEAQLLVEGEASSARPEISKDGAVRFRGRVDELVGARTGTTTLRFVVGARSFELQVVILPRGEVR
jgi:hypothetical protein